MYSALTLGNLSLLYESQFSSNQIIEGSKRTYLPLHIRPKVPLHGVFHPKLFTREEHDFAINLPFFLFVKLSTADLRALQYTIFLAHPKRREKLVRLRRDERPEEDARYSERLARPGARCDT